jgi:hypothetical protein
VKDGGKPSRTDMLSRFPFEVSNEPFATPYVEGKTEAARRRSEGSFQLGQVIGIGDGRTTRSRPIYEAESPSLQPISPVVCDGVERDPKRSGN